MWLSLLTQLALAEEPAIRLILVGDTGKDTPVAAVVSAEITRRMTDAPDAILVALGDLYYNQPPAADADCAAQTAARYRSFFGTIDAARTQAVAGNHDVAEPETHAWSPAARACTEAAFRDLGWLGAAEALANRTRQLDGGGLTLDLVLVEGGMFSSEHPALPDLRADADWQIVATHYLLAASFGKDKPEIGQYYGMPVDHVPDLWVNGHAHHLEGRAAKRTFAVTSGAGMQMREFGGWAYKRPASTFAWVRCDSDDQAWCDAKAASGKRPAGLIPKAKEAGGFVVLDLLPRQPDQPLRATLTPVVCVDGVCEEKPVTTCERRADGRGSICR